MKSETGRSLECTIWTMDPAIDKGEKGVILVLPGRRPELPLEGLSCGLPEGTHPQGRLVLPGSICTQEEVITLKEIPLRRAP
eukprot:gene26010-biopygen12896